MTTKPPMPPSIEFKTILRAVDKLIKKLSRHGAEFDADIVTEVFYHNPYRRDRFLADVDRSEYERVRKIPSVLAAIDIPTIKNRDGGRTFFHCFVPPTIDRAACVLGNAMPASICWETLMAAREAAYRLPPLPARAGRKYLKAQLSRIRWQKSHESELAARHKAVLEYMRRPKQ